MAERINEATISIMREQLLNKRVSVSGIKYEGRDLGPINGVCTFFGYNNHLPSYDLQITVDRQPITNISLSQITIID